MSVKFVENIQSEIACPNCRRKLIVKTNRHTGHQFLGCPNWPECDHTREIPQAWIMQAIGQPRLL